MDIAERKRQLFFNNLIILGFDKDAIEKQHRISCDKNMFCVPNQKMFEIVSNFLFSKLNVVSERKYELPWPLLDNEKRRQFQKACFNHLSNIAKDSNIKFPRIVASLLSTFGGDRFYELLLALSMHVVKETITKKGIVSPLHLPTVSPQSRKAAIETLQISTILSVEKFQKVQKCSAIYFKNLLNIANTFTTHVQNLQSSLLSNQSLCKEEISRLVSLCPLNQDKAETSSLRPVIKSVMEYKKKVVKLWQQFEHFSSKEDIFWSHIGSEVKDSPERHVLSGDNLQFTISDSLKRISTELDQNGRISENGKICLLKFLKVFCIILQFYLKNIEKGDLSHASKLCSVKEPLGFEESLKHLTSLNDKLVTDILPSVTDHTKQLEESLLLKEFSEGLEVFIQECPSWNCCSLHLQESTESAGSPLHSSQQPEVKDSCSSLQSEVYEKLCNVPWLNSNFMENSSSIKAVDTLCTVSLPEQNQVSSEVILSETKLCYFKENVQDSGNHELKNRNSNFTDSLLDTVFDETLANPEKSSLFLEGPNAFYFDHRGPYKLRESWQAVDSLNSMTLSEPPSFLDESDLL